MPPINTFNFRNKIHKTIIITIQTYGKLKEAKLILGASVKYSEDFEVEF